MPENPHGHPGVDVQSRQQRRAGPPCPMHGDPPYPSAPDPAVKRSVEIARLYRSAVTGREDQPGLYPLRAKLVAFVVLLGFAELERSQADLWKRETRL